jgi:hypothetical protein
MLAIAKLQSDEALSHSSETQFRNVDKAPLMPRRMTEALSNARAGTYKCEDRSSRLNNRFSAKITAHLRFAPAPLPPCANWNRGCIAAIKLGPALNGFCVCKLRCRLS